MLSVLLVLSTRSTILENVLAKNYNANIIPTEDNLCRYQIPQANTVCHAYNLNIRTNTDRMSEQDSNFDNSITLAGSFLKHYAEDRADELGYDGDLYQSDNASGVGDVNSRGNVMPAFVGHSHGGQDGGHYGGDNHPGTGDGGEGNRSHHGSTNGRGGGNGNGHNDGSSSHNGNNDQNNKHSGDSNKNNNNNNNNNNIRRCIPVTLSDLPGQTQPLELCLIIGVDTNVATEIGNATFTLSQSSGGEFKLTINGLNGQTQPAIVSTKSGMRTPIIVPGLGTGNVLVGVFIH